METKSVDATKFFEDGGMDMLIGFEEKFDCSGYCDMGEYFISKDLKEGRPQKECVEGLLGGFGKKAKPAGYVTIVAGLLLWVAMIGAFPLCSGF